MIKVCIDTNCINFLQKSDAINKVEHWAKQGKLELVASQKLFDETANKWGWDKANGYHNICQPFILDVTPLDKSRFARFDFPKQAFHVLLPILFPKKSIDTLDLNDFNDAVHLLAAIDEKCEFFLTRDKAFLVEDRPSTIVKQFAIRIVDPDGLVRELAHFHNWQ